MAPIWSCLKVFEQESVEAESCFDVEDDLESFDVERFCMGIPAVPAMVHTS